VHREHLVVRRLVHHLEAGHGQLGADGEGEGAADDGEGEDGDAAAARAARLRSMTLAEARAGGLGAAVPTAADAPPAAAPLPPLPPLPVLLCACKTEVRPRAVPEAEARAWAERSGLAGYFETSASLGTGQVEVFARLESLAAERALAAEAREMRGAVR
jgi:hypothetical protein